MIHSPNNRAIVVASATIPASTASSSRNPINFSEVPVSALGYRTKASISILLNPCKVLPSEEGFPRDWRGLAHLAGIQGDHFPQLNGLPDPTGKILSIWGQNATLHDLQTIFERLDRWDVLDDTQEMFDEDARHYVGNRMSQLTISATGSATPVNNEHNMLTVDDITRDQQGLAMQSYDAFVLFADEDINFAVELIQRMEEFGFKLCVKDRDLLGGITFEHEAIMRLIAERCTRLIVIVSPAFLQSAANSFFVNFAQALGIEQRKRKIVPCLYQRCPLPPQLSYYFILDYQRSGRLWNFWEKLRESLQSNTAVAAVSSVYIREVESPQTLALRAPISSHMSSLTNLSSSTTAQPTSTYQEPDSYSENYTSSLSDLRLTHSETVSSVTPSPSVASIETQNIRKARKMKWFKKLLSPNSGNKNDDQTTKEKKKWFTKKIPIASI